MGLYLRRYSRAFLPQFFRSSMACFSSGRMRTNQLLRPFLCNVLLVLFIAQIGSNARE